MAGDEGLLGVAVKGERVGDIVVIHWWRNTARVESGEWNRVEWRLSSVLGEGDDGVGRAVVH